MTTDARAEAILAALAPYLREPTGWELDVEAVRVAISEFKTNTDVRNYILTRIRPTFACQECAKMRDEVTFWKRENVASNNKMLAARAALEGE